MIFCANGTANNEAEDVADVIDKLTNDANEVDEVEVDEVEVEKNENIADVRDYMDLELDQHSNLQHNLEQSSSSTENRSKFEIENLLSKLLSKAYQDDKTMNSIIDAKQRGLQKLPADLTKQSIKFAMGDLTLKGSGSSTKLYVKSRMYAPNDKNLRLFLLQQHHNPPV